MNSHSLDILDGYVAAFGRLDEIGHVVRHCESRADAIKALTSPTLGFSEAHAQHILDLSLAQQPRAIVSL